MAREAAVIQGCEEARVLVVDEWMNTIDYSVRFDLQRNRFWAWGRP